MRIPVVALALLLASLGCASHGDDNDAPTGGGVLCPLWIAPGIMIEVRDVVTGMPAACGSSGKAESAGLIEPLETGVDCAATPDFLYLSGIDRPGTYTVTIERPGYQAWIRGGIEVVGGVCGLITVQMRADLVPL